MAKDIEELIREANAGLKALRAGVRIEKPNTSDRLYLRARLPEKPGSGRQGTRRQYIPLKIYANKAGLKRAISEAKRLSEELGWQTFTWDNWIKAEAQQRTIGDWVEAYKKDYFQKKGHGQAKISTWKTNYQTPYNKLNWDAQLSEQVLRDALLLMPVDSSTRRMAAISFRSLLRFAGIEANFNDVKGRYSPKAVDPRTLPSDEEIEQVRLTIKNPQWRYAYSLMAAYGLRNHEIFFCDRADLGKAPGILEIVGGKSVSLDPAGGARKVWPLKKQWWEDWGLAEGELPTTTSTSHRSMGHLVSGAFTRYKVPFTPYVLRHCWAARASACGLDVEIAAKMMGHSLEVHVQTYLRFLDASRFQKAWERSQD